MTTIIQDLEESNHNPDIQANIYGKLLHTRGIKIRLTNVETVDEHTIARWKRVCANHGYNTTMEHHLSDGYITLICRDTTKPSTLTIAIACTTTLLIAQLFRSHIL